MLQLSIAGRCGRDAEYKQTRGGTDLDALVKEYEEGASARDLAAKHGLSDRTIRRRLHDAGVMRDKSAAVLLAHRQGKHSWREDEEKARKVYRSMAATKRRHADEWAKGYYLDDHGYYRLSRRGVNEGRLVHVVLMEERIGRRILPDECVHHIDGNPLNNNMNNLALMTRGAHSRLHRYEDALVGKRPARSSRGTFEGNK